MHFEVRQILSLLVDIRALVNLVLFGVLGWMPTPTPSRQFDLGYKHAPHIFFWLSISLNQELRLYN